MRLEILQDGVEEFNVTVHAADKKSPVVLFAVGAGGQPERYRTLLEKFAKSGYTVIAPHFDRLVSPYPKEEDLIL